MSIFHPVRRAASRTFCPFFPMARDNCESATTTRADFFSSSTPTFSMVAGFNASAINTLGSEVQVMMSIFSPRSSRTTACTRDPLMPTQAPTGSTAFSREVTAILVRSPGSRTTALISTIFSITSGTSNSKSLATNCGWLRVRMTWTSFGVRRTSRSMAFTRSPRR